MNKFLRTIREGIIVEEDMVYALTSELAATDQFKGLAEDKKNRIKNILEILKKDTLRHKNTLEEIADRY